MLTERFTEITGPIVGGAIDRKACLVRDVKLVGLSSRNGRQYRPKALEEAVPLYEGAMIFVDHTEDRSRARRYTERLARVEEVTFRQDGLYGNLRYNPQHAAASSFLYDAENRTNGVGLSHCVAAKVKNVKGTTFVERILKVESVDLVVNPAATDNLFEQEEDSVKLPVKKVNPKDVDEQDAAVDTGTATKSPRQALADHVASIITSDLKPDEIMTQVAEILKATFATQKKAGGEGSNGGKGDEGDEGESEQLKHLEGRIADLSSGLLEIAADTQLRRAGIVPTEPRIKAVLACEEKGVDDLIASFKSSHKKSSVQETKEETPSSSVNGRKAFLKAVTS
jgi:Rod binding domain-containing protein